eukprot:s991_g23.t1
MAGQEPKELVSCGKCNSINSVPFGLDLFKCYNCGASVVISRESSSSCAAASPTALYLDSMQGQEGGSSSSKGKKNEAEKSSGSSSRGFFDRLQRQVDKTLQKVEQSLFDGSAPPAPPPKVVSADKLPVGERPNSEVLKRTEAGGYPKSTASGDLAGQLKAAEDKALRLEQLLEAATAREAVSSSERRVLRKQLDETEQLVSGLSQQLDSVQSEAAEQRRQCEALEKALEEATQPQDRGTEELQKRIAELEAELQSLRHLGVKAKPLEALSGA